ncbi:MAG: hypothetical protein R2940_08495 [Syntrophotaleaceae bacterium]
MKKQQYVCLVCGFNMVGFLPETCPFCGARQENFITAEECSARYRVKGSPVNDRVTRLNSEPGLGFEHAAYRIETDDKVCWIDCPSSFDSSLAQMDAILFTHHHFLGACNLYREHYGATVSIHEADSSHELCRPFIFDETFLMDFRHHGIEAFHVDGHTPGFTCYIFQDTLFVCDYVFLDGDRMKFNPFGPLDRTMAGGRRLREQLEGRNLAQVCGYNYVIEFPDWLHRFDQGPTFEGF